MRLALLVVLSASSLLAACDDAPSRCEDGVGCCRSSRDCEGWESCDERGFCGPARHCAGASDCLGADVCSPNGWCGPEPSFDPREAALWGYVGAAGWFLGGAPVDEPTRVRAGIYPESAIIHRVALDGLGNVIYLGTRVEAAGVVHRVFRFVPDPWFFDIDTWRPAPDAFENDVVLDTPACMPTSMVARPRRDDVFYGCSDGNVYDSTGELIAEAAVPLGATYDGALLLDAGTGLDYMRPDGTRVPSYFPYEPDDILAVRSTGKAFWVVAWDPLAGRAIRYVVGHDYAVPVNSYPRRGCENLCAEHAIDAEGAVYRHYPDVDERGRPVFGVERCTGRGCERVHDGRDAPELHDVPGEPPRRTVLPLPPYPSVISGP